MLERVRRHADWTLLITTLLLTAAGVLVLFATSVKAANVVSPVDASHQLIFALGGLAVLIGCTLFDYRLLQRFWWLIYGASVGLLGVVLLAGHTALGATRWINIGFLQFQPSEVAKLALIISLAAVLAQLYDQLEQPKYLLASVGLTALPLVLVLAQPDLGTALVLGVIWLVAVLVSPIPKGYVLALLFIGLLALPLGIQTLKPYQRDRLAVFLNPSADPLGRGFNVVQATIAVGSGQVAGRGLAAGSQSQLNFLPSQHTDFIFAVLAEKLGFVGACLILGLFTVLLARLLLIASRARDRFGMLLVVGISTMLLFHIFVNVGMNMGIMPVTGIPLPFLSYGGTSLLVAMAAVGLAQSVAVRHKKISF